MYKVQMSSHLYNTDNFFFNLMWDIINLSILALNYIDIVRF